jgi:CRP/FNR family transcriptional regulator, cyclic AMP receptor protein
MSDALPHSLSESGRFFSELPEALATELRRYGKRKTAAKGGHLHRKGDTADGLYCVLSGRIRISTLAADGRELVLTDLGEGSVFGEISLFDDLPRTHDAVALQRSELVLVPKADFHALLAKHPELARHFLRELAQKLRLSFTVLDALALQGVTERLAQRLCWLFDHDARSRTAGLQASQSDLAAMVGATRQSINKQLKAWERDGVLALRGRSILVLDRAALRRAGGLPDDAPSSPARRTQASSARHLRRGTT